MNYFIRDNIDLLGSELRDRLVADIVTHIGDPICVSENARALVAFQAMFDNNVSGIFQRLLTRRVWFNRMIIEHVSEWSMILESWSMLCLYATYVVWT